MDSEWKVRTDYYVRLTLWNVQSWFLNVGTVGNKHQEMVHGKEEIIGHQDKLKQLNEQCGIVVYPTLHAPLHMKH